MRFLAYSAVGMSSCLESSSPALPVALEFFCGIGAFAAAATGEGVVIRGAFDQDPTAGGVYGRNWRLSPSKRNLDSIGPHEIPAADLWWLSPPCTPYTIRGARHDVDDPRAASLLNLLDLIGLLGASRPRWLFIENVPGFVGSRAEKRLVETFERWGYGFVRVALCPTLFGVPMRRPRVFFVASLDGAPAVDLPAAAPTAPLAGFLDFDPEEGLDVDSRVEDNHGEALDVVRVNHSEAIVSCVTRGYAKSHVKSGSFLRRPDGGLRRLSPGEIARLLGFPAGFAFEPNTSLRRRWQLVGNSVDVRSIRFLLAAAGVGQKQEGGA